MTFPFEQLQTVVQEPSSIPSANWFATLDAAQIAHDAGVDWAEYGARYDWKNLLYGTVEGEEPDLTCWLLPLTEETLKLTAELVKASPFSCTWLQSSWEIGDIATLWQQTSNPRLPNGQHALLRFYDPCVLLALRTVLTTNQWQTLSAPTVQWLYMGRDGLLASLSSPNKTVRRYGQLTLTADQLKQLQELGRADKLILQMQVNDHLPYPLDHFAAHKHVATALDLLNKHHIATIQDQYLFAALTLDWPLAHFASAPLDQALSRYGQETTDLSQIVALHSPRGN